MVKVHCFNESRQSFAFVWVFNYDGILPSYVNEVLSICLTHGSNVSHVTHEVWMRQYFVEVQRNLS